MTVGAILGRLIHPAPRQNLPLSVVPSTNPARSSTAGPPSERTRPADITRAERARTRAGERAVHVTIGARDALVEALAGHLSPTAAGLMGYEHRRAAALAALDRAERCPVCRYAGTLTEAEARASWGDR